MASKRYVGFLASVTNLKSQYLNSESQRNQKRRKHESLNSNEFTGKFNSCDLSDPMTSLTQISFTISLNIAAKCGSAALAACFPGGSITGAPKFRAMEIIDELEPVSRGPYTGALGYLGFNRESQLSVTIRTAICKGGTAYFHVGAGIVADSIPAAEYEETLDKGGGFVKALRLQPEVRVESA